MRKNSCKSKISAKAITILIFGCFIISAVLNFNNIVMAYEKSYSNITRYDLQTFSENMLQNDASIINTISQTNGINTDEEEVVYLSDLNYITTNNWSYNGWSGHSITKDKNQENGPIKLKIDGEVCTFAKGVAIHATGQATYDISEYSTKYPRFITYLGVDASKTQEANFWIEVSVSQDGETWDSLHKTGNITPASNAVKIDVNVEGYKYLRIYVDSNGSNSADHGTLGDAKFVIKDYEPVEIPEYDKVHPLEYYDNILKDNDVEYNYQNNYRTILEREFVRKIGYDYIKTLTSTETNKYKNLFNWILSDDNTVLEQIIEVGDFKATPFIDDLVSIYSKHKEDLNEQNGYVYQKVMIALAAAHSSDTIMGPTVWTNETARYNPVNRYELIKELFDNKKLKRLSQNGTTGTLVDNDWFKDYSMPLMRNVVHDWIDDIEFKWLNGYSHDKIKFNYNAIKYTSANAGEARFKDEANRETYTNKYLLNNYGVNVPYGADSGTRYWMVLEHGGICWNISRFGQTLYRVNGLPAVGGYSPGHEFFYNYYQRENGEGYWSPRYGSWKNGGTKWGGMLRFRYPLDWANKSFTDQNIGGNKGGTSSGYLYLAQSNLNRYEDYQKSLYYNITANSYADNNEKLNTYFESLKINNINLDTYENIINLYKKMSVKNEGGTITSKDWHDLAVKIIDEYTYYPVAMYDLIKVIRPYLDDTDRVIIDGLENEALQTAATSATDATSNSGEGAKIHANQLLGKAQPQAVTFSFDGNNAGKLVRNPIYQIAWAYSLDGGTTYSEYVNVDEVTLTAEELDTITIDNDIKIAFMGVESYNFTIDITKGTKSTLIYANDLEDAFFGYDGKDEWRYSNDDEWTKFVEAEPDCTGTKQVQIRVDRTGTKIASDPITINFKPSTDTNVKTYIPISHLSIHSVSSQNEPASNIIDGNYNTYYHSKTGQKTVSIIIKLDRKKVISALDFKQKLYQGNTNYAMLNITASISEDGNSWKQIGKQAGQVIPGILELPIQDQNLRTINCSSNKDFAQYVRLVITTNGGVAGLSIVNLYENTEYSSIGSFSFDGENAGKIMIEDEYKDSNWEYSLDGGETWKLGSENKLSDEEIEQINADDDIKVRFEENISEEHVINIERQATPQISAYANDLENMLIGIGNVTGLEWKLENENTWKTYSETEPVVTGNNKLQVRKKATDKFVPSDVCEYTFTEDNQPDTAKYIPIKHLSINSFSSENVRPNNNQYEYARNSIDGNINTQWHTSRVATNDQKFIVIKLDEPKYISKIQYVKQAGYVYGVPKNGIISVSMDGENWEEAVAFENLYNPVNKDELAAAENQKDIIINEPKEALYVKIQVTKSCDYVNGSKDGVPFDYFFAATMFNLFEDITKKEQEAPTAEIEYSTESLTNSDVVATLVNPSTDITITNNGGSNRYVFTENGSFTFTFVDGDGNRGIATASVDWIDKEAPVATIVYNTQNPTNQDVIATVTFDEENVTVEGGNTHTFTENGDYTFTFVDEAGNEGNATANVDWIDKIAPVATITYSTTNYTNQDVIASITFDEENVTVEGGDTYTFTENGDYTFTFVDEAGNRGTATASVDWIIKTLPNAKIEYSTKSLTNQDVVATISFDREGTRVTNNDGSTTYTFTENGEFTFEFVGPYGNSGVATAKVDWIDKKVPVATITYSTTNNTNQDVIASIIFDKQNVTVEGGDTYTFTENGDYTFTFVDEAGNTGSATAKVDWIDKKVPVATITYNTINPTNEAVIATVTFDKEGTIITNNNGSNQYTFTENGEFTFEFVDKVGNKGTAVAKVNWINTEEEFEITSSKYTIKERMILNVGEKTSIETFKGLLTVNRPIKVVDKEGKEQVGEEIVKTGMKLKVEEENIEYTIVVIGDLNGDGRRTITDLAKAKLHIIEEEILENENLQALDVDKNGTISITDIAILKMSLIGLKEID